MGKCLVMGGTCGWVLAKAGLAMHLMPGQFFTAIGAASAVVLWRVLQRRERDDGR